MSLLQRFLAKVAIKSRDECWEWKAYKDKLGYGRILVDGRSELSHRISYQLHGGTLLPGQCVCHKCDNPKCVNPNHLFAGSYADNARDRERKGRRVPPKGTINGRAMLTEEDIKIIRTDLDVTQVEMAKRFGVGQSQISRIRRGEHWKHLS